MSKKVLFIGVDGATFDVLDPLMAKGLMPRLNRFIDEGVRGLIETTIAPITATAWVSWMTGKNPGKTRSLRVSAAWNQPKGKQLAGRNRRKLRDTKADQSNSVSFESRA